MLIDFHTHAFPDKLAPRALPPLAERIHSEPLYDGTVGGLLASLDRWGVDRAVICNIATNPKQTENVNSFAIETQKEHGDRLSPLGSLNPECDPAFMERELTRLSEAGIRGLKIHPDYTGHTIDDPQFDPVFSLAAAHGMFLVTHAGFDVYSPDFIHASPERILRRLERSPDAVLVAAHYGGNKQWDEVEEKLIGKNLWIDTSLGGFCGLAPAQAKRMLTLHDPEKILFGSDAPWCSSAETLAYLDSLGLSAGLTERITHKNAEALLGL